MQGANIEGGAAIRAQIDGAAGMGSHGIEMAGMKMQRLALARCRAVCDVLALQTGLYQNVVVDTFRKLHGIALAHALYALDQARFGTTFHIEKRNLDSAGSDIDPRCD